MYGRWAINEKLSRFEDQKNQRDWKWSRELTLYHIQYMKKTQTSAMDFMLKPQEKLRYQQNWCTLNRWYLEYGTIRHECLWTEKHERFWEYLYVLMISQVSDAVPLKTNAQTMKDSFENNLISLERRRNLIETDGGEDFFKWKPHWFRSKSFRK